jgi:20S proteasome subunit alpha 5
VSACLPQLLSSFQSITLKQACIESLKILKQVMEEKLNATNVEVKNSLSATFPCLSFLCLSLCVICFSFNTEQLLFFQMAKITPGKGFQMFTKEELEEIIKEL